MRNFADQICEADTFDAEDEDIEPEEAADDYDDEGDLDDDSDDDE